MLYVCGYCRKENIIHSSAGSLVLLGGDETFTGAFTRPSHGGVLQDYVELMLGRQLGHYDFMLFLLFLLSVPCFFVCVRSWAYGFLFPLSARPLRQNYVVGTRCYVFLSLSHSFLTIFYQVLSFIFFLLICCSSSSSSSVETWDQKASLRLDGGSRGGPRGRPYPTTSVFMRRKRYCRELLILPLKNSWMGERGLGEVMWERERCWRCDRRQREEKSGRKSRSLGRSWWRSRRETLRVCVCVCKKEKKWIDRDWGKC